MKKLLTGAILAAALGTSAHAASISFDPQSTTVAAGSTVAVNLDISGVNNGTTAALGAWDVNVSVDPRFLTLTSTTFGTNLDVHGLGDSRGTDSPAVGTTHLYEISLDSAQDLATLQKQSFTLATLYFLAAGQGTTSLNVKVNSLSDPNGGSIAASTLPGQMTISAVPIPASGWLLLSATLLLPFHSRRARALTQQQFCA